MLDIPENQDNDAVKLYYILHEHYLALAFYTNLALILSPAGYPEMWYLIAKLFCIE
jgi:hypothetical protein